MISSKDWLSAILLRKRQRLWIAKLAKLINHGSAEENLMAAESYLEAWPESLNDDPRNHVENEGCCD